MMMLICFVNHPVPNKSIRLDNYPEEFRYKAEQMWRLFKEASKGVPRVTSMPLKVSDAGFVPSVTDWFIKTFDFVLAENDKIVQLRSNIWLSELHRHNVNFQKMSLKGK